MAKGVCLHWVDVLLRVVVDVLLQVVVDDDLEVAEDGPHQDVEDGDLPQAGGLLREEVDGADHLQGDVAHCYRMLVEAGDQFHWVEHFGELLNRPSNQPADPAIRQISFFVCHYRVRAVFENAPG